MPNNPFAQRRELWKQRADLMRQIEHIDAELTRITFLIEREYRTVFQEETDQKGGE